METNTGRDLPVEKITKDNYSVPKGEEKLYHAVIEVKKFNADTGDRQSIPRIQKFGSKAFKTILKNLKKQGFTVDILHNPTEWLAEKKEAQTTTALERATKNKEAAEEKKALELQTLKDELRKELLAELKAESKPAAAKVETPAAVKVETPAAAKPGALPTK